MGNFMRVCLFNPPLETCLANRIDVIIEVLRKLEYEIEMVKDIKPIIVYADSRLFNKYNLFLPFRLLRALFLSMGRFKKRFDLIFSFTDPFRGIIGVILGKLLSIPIVFDLWYTFVDSQIQQGYWRYGGFNHILGHLVEYLAVKLAGSVLIANYIKKYVLNTYEISPSKVFPFPNLIDFTLYDPAKFDSYEIREKYGFDSNTFLVMYHGTFLAVHGLEYAIKAFPQVISIYQNVKLLLIGPFNENCKKIENLVKKLKISNHVIFAGVIQNEIMPKFLNAADVSLGIFSANPRARRTFRYSAIESMAMGLPLITSDSSGVRHLTDYENVIKVPFEDHESIAEALLYLIENKEKRLEIGKNAREFIFIHYNVKKAEKIIKSAIKKAING
jgi:glycosyltransferase involved in cell wall biosynthesis